ncbi:crossover junction endodeoxyribonuclease RuvC [Candidatus Beckwithbacteria bacterium RIFCSPLOWO2_02_FULL_47_23]|uniref:Crossover junction endodeoxyribonuclease RuvC n=2 Tax=Candidatus Beckwithiibacteriota TaxID=1752726 RepID=A0A1F5DTD3_9BACT|nr:MAG: crossover junction endodeoxyribonuclease RuvC [Candidatus Beckwithbacteria bacterium RIFCSPHIGHO2_12_FULL_47_17]OGD58372.1 MAG: crossover junction endodeoxyribonuclease RuvC [Candidatus Beckwithbacteria bacterium RIFCSPLOWO2_02_FULL_47_23]
MRILGVDPGTARLGWGVINGEEMVSCGCVETKVGLAEEARLKTLFEKLSGLIKKYQPEAAAVEKLFFFKNQTTVISVAQSRGVVLLACAQNHLPVFSYTPLQIKQAVTGYGRAEKNQVQQMVRSILKLKSIPRPDDAADALAVALTHEFSHKLKSRVK